MNIAVDLDDSVADLICKLILFHNETYGTCLQRDDFKSYQYEKVWGGTKVEAIRKVQEFIKSDYFKSIVPLAGSQEAMAILKKSGHNLFVVTGREEYLDEVTSIWVGQYFLGIFSGIYHTNSYTEGTGKINKSAVCKELNAPIIIEDDLMHIVDCSNAGIKVLVYDNPWNRYELPAGAVRVSAWSQIVDIINELD